MSEYRISNSMYKRIQERKSRLITWLFICAALQLGIVLVYAFGGKDGIILGCILEPILLFLVWKSFRHDIRSVFYKNKQGKILFCDIDRYVNRSISGVGVRGATYNSRTKINYILNVSTDEGKIIEIPLPDKDAYLCYKKDDEVLLISYTRSWTKLPRVAE